MIKIGRNKVWTFTILGMLFMLINHGDAFSLWDYCIWDDRVAFYFSHYSLGIYWK